MENTNLKGLVIDGQPQGLGNKMVTYDGLRDFLVMLKYEIPRMGSGNNLSGDYSYVFGNGNSHEGKCGFTVGEGNNVIGNYSYCLGSANTAESVNNGWIIGSKIKCQNSNNVFIIGQNDEQSDSVEYQNINQCFILGRDNTVTSVSNGWIIGSNIKCQESNNVFIIGQNQKSDSTEGVDGIEQCFILGCDNSLSNTNQVFMAGMNLQQPDAIMKRDYPTYILGSYNKGLHKENSINPTSYFGNPAVIIGNGTADDDDHRNNLFVLDYYSRVHFAGTPALSSGTNSYDWNADINLNSYTEKDKDGNKRTVWSRIVDRSVSNLNKQCLVYYERGLRHILHPWNNELSDDFNEAIWNVRDKGTVKDDDPKKSLEDTLYINRSNAADRIDSPVGAGWNSAKGRNNAYAPQNIHFHAGTDKSWANIKCGNIQCTKLSAGYYRKQWEFDKDTEVIFDWMSICRRHTLVQVYLDFAEKDGGAYLCDWVLCVPNYDYANVLGGTGDAGLTLWQNLLNQNLNFANMKWGVTFQSDRIVFRGPGTDKWSVTMTIYPLAPAASDMMIEEKEEEQE